MALLSFPSNPSDNDLYPNVPVVGQSQYRWSAVNQTWILEGTATGVTPGCYGSATSVPAICVDAQGRLTAAADVAIAVPTPDLQDVTDAGAVTTNTIDVGGLVAAGLVYPSADGASGDYLTTDGAGTLGWSSTLKVVAAPSTQTDSGAAGEVAFDAGYWYWHDGSDWQRVVAEPPGW